MIEQDDKDKPQYKEYPNPGWVKELYSKEKKMKLCYLCYLSNGGDSKMWDKTAVDVTVKEKCEKCGLNGLMVREVDATE